jgi:hypothetical protein
MALFSWIVRRKRDFLIEFVDPAIESRSTAWVIAAAPRRRWRRFRFLHYAASIGRELYTFNPAEKPRPFGEGDKWNKGRGRVKYG